MPFSVAVWRIPFLGRNCLSRVDTVEKVRKKINGERLVHVIAM